MRFPENNVSYSPEEKKELKTPLPLAFREECVERSIFGLYWEFLASQEEKGKKVPFTENAFDLYDLAALAYLYKRIKREPTESGRRAM